MLPTLSETRRVTDRFIPEDATVEAKKYTDIMSVNNPSPSVPICAEINILNAMDMTLRESEVTVNIMVFFINF